MAKRKRRPTQLPKIAPHDACVVCFKGDTTTALAFAAPLEVQTAGLRVLGIPDDQADAIIRMWGSDDEPVIVTVCQQCAAESPFRQAFPVDGPIPVISPTRSYDDIEGA